MPTIRIEHSEKMMGGDIKRLAVEADIGDKLDYYFEFLESWLKAIGFNQAVIEEHILEWADEIKLNRGNAADS